MTTQSSTTKKCTFRRMKQYRCKGFGDCTMVFSRSEHLARHTRKHTGEKPFRCEFPDCDRYFSRFDNMRQHCQTHQKFKKQNNKQLEGGIQIQPRPFEPSLGGGGEQMNYLATTATLLSSEEQRKGTQATGKTNSKAMGNTVRADSPPGQPYSSTTSNNSQHGLVSPVSLSGTFEEQPPSQQYHYQDTNTKQEIPDCKQDLHCLTQDELDALDGLNQFQQSPHATSGTTTTTGPMANIESD